MNDFIESHQGLLTKSKKFSEIVDIIADCLADNNNKVVTSCQDLLNTQMDHLKIQLEKNARTIIDALASGVIATNSLVSQSSMRLLKKLVLNETLECSKFVQPMCS